MKIMIDPSVKTLLQTNHFGSFRLDTISKNGKKNNISRKQYHPPTQHRIIIKGIVSRSKGCL